MSEAVEATLAAFRNWAKDPLIQREFPAREGGGESKVQRLWDMMYE